MIEKYIAINYCNANAQPSSGVNIDKNASHPTPPFRPLHLHCNRRQHTHQARPAFAQGLVRKRKKKPESRKLVYRKKCIRHIKKLLNVLITGHIWITYRYT